MTRPLLRAVDLIETEAEWASADILLVSDGELQNPPVKPEVMDVLRRQEVDRGLEVSMWLTKAS